MLVLVVALKEGDAVATGGRTDGNDGFPWGRAGQGVRPGWAFGRNGPLSLGKGAVDL